jgi:hypothetical protein
VTSPLSLWISMSSMLSAVVASLNAFAFAFGSGMTRLESTK